MAVMQRQESFNRFYQEFVVDKAPQCTEGGPDESGMCVYLNEETGKGCAIGIQPEFKEIYTNHFEEMSIAILYKHYPEIRGIIAAQDLTFFEELQLIHDNEMQSPETISDRIVEFAANFGVDIPSRPEAK